MIRRVPLHRISLAPRLRIRGAADPSLRIAAALFVNAVGLAALCAFGLILVGGECRAEGAGSAICAPARSLGQGR